MLIRQHDHCTGHSKMSSFTVLGRVRKPVSMVWPPFASRSATHLLHIELIRLLIVACGMLVHSSSMAVQSRWILAETGTHCRIRRSRASQTCSMGDMSGEYAGHARTGMFSASRNCVPILATWAVHYHAATWGDCRGWMAQQRASGSHYGSSVHSKCTCVHSIRLPIP